jgi:hypothetical protein
MFLGIIRTRIQEKWLLIVELLADRAQRGTASLDREAGALHRLIADLAAIEEVCPFVCQPPVVLFRPSAMLILCSPLGAVVLNVPMSDHFSRAFTIGALPVEELLKWPLDRPQEL